MSCRLVALLAASIAITAPSLAQADTAESFNLFVLGDMQGLNSATEGRVAVGGSASIQNYQIGAAGLADAANFVVGGSLNATSLQTKGQTIVGGTATTLWGSPNVQTPGTALPVDFAAEAIRLKALSAELAGVSANGATLYTLPAWAQSGQHHQMIALTGTQAGLNVFDLDAVKLADASTFTIDLSPGSTALINVSGLSGAYFQTNFSITGGDASSLLWNFSEATSLSMYNTGSGFKGSVLAPLATYSPAGWGAIDGQLIVGSFLSNQGSTRVNAVNFAGDLLKTKPPAPISALAAAVPEPATWMTMILGFGLIGAMLRLRNAGLSAAV